MTDFGAGTIRPEPGCLNTFNHYITPGWAYWFVSIGRHHLPMWALSIVHRLTEAGWCSRQCRLKDSASTWPWLMSVSFGCPSLCSVTEVSRASTGLLFLQWSYWYLERYQTTRSDRSSLPRASPSPGWHRRTWWPTASSGSWPSWLLAYHSCPHTRCLCLCTPGSPWLSSLGIGSGCLSGRFPGLRGFYGCCGLRHCWWVGSWWS